MTMPSSPEAAPSRTAKPVGRRSFVLHLHPPKVEAAALRFSLTFGLGGMALTLFSLLAATGLLLAFIYEPTPAGAYGSVLSLRNDHRFGQWIRNIHHWSATGMVVVTVLHLLRVLLTGGYTGEGENSARKVNWLIGLGLLAGVLASVFTGYLLPWDQLSYWAITICTEMLEYVPLAGGWLREMARGGDGIGAPTLLRFYALHTSVLPTLLVLTMGFHFWRVRKARGVVAPAYEVPGERVDAVPNLVVREAAVGLALVAFILCFAALVDAPLAAQANPGLSPNPAKAPWYFLGIQELLIHFHPFVAVVVLPLVALSLLAALPWLRYDELPQGRWFLSQKGKATSLGAAATALAVTPLLLVFDEFAYAPWANNAGMSDLVTRGLIPLGAAALFVAGFRWFLKNKLSLTRAEQMQALFVLFSVGFLLLTLTGIYFRGEQMALMWAGW